MTVLNGVGRLMAMLQIYLEAGDPLSLYTAKQAIASKKFGEESPDSKGQPSGEEPGSIEKWKQKVPQKITAMKHTCMFDGKGENVR